MILNHHTKQIPDAKACLKLASVAVFFLTIMLELMAKKIISTNPCIHV
jgi:hypothetical protein